MTGAAFSAGTASPVYTVLDLDNPRVGSIRLDAAERAQPHSCSDRSVIVAAIGCRCPLCATKCGQHRS